MTIKRFFKIFSIVLCFIILTIFTQIGGIIFIINNLYWHNSSKRYFWKSFISFMITYIIVTFLLIPTIAPWFGRVKIAENKNLTAQSFFTKLCNRNYVRSPFNQSLQKVSQKFGNSYPNIQIQYLDANFPFFDKFPLLPHLSHNDGKKIDLSFIYKNQDGQLTNSVPALFGYGAFVHPTKKEYDQTKICKNKGYWQYDITKYITFGLSNTSLSISEKATKDVLHIILNQKETQKVFIEPHLKKKMGLQHNKIRFHGCQAVRHDDHIHWQVY